MVYRSYSMQSFFAKIVEQKVKGESSFYNRMH